MNRADDLTILLRARDLTKGPLSSLSKRLKSIGPTAKVALGIATAAAASLAVVLGNAVTRGRELALSLTDTARQIDLSFRETQALFLSVRDAAGDVDLDNLNEAVLSLKERIADARLETGPLFGLLQDLDGFELDLNVTNSRFQLADFLEQVGELDNAEDRIFAIKEVLGDEDGRPFLRTIQNTEKLNDLIGDLRTNIDDVPDVFSQQQVDDIDDYRRSLTELTQRWDDYSLALFADFAPAMTTVNNVLVAGIDLLDEYGQMAKTITSFITDTLIPSITITLADFYRRIPEPITSAISQVAGVASTVFNGVNGMVADGFALLRDEVVGTVDFLNGYVEQNTPALEGISSDALSGFDLSDETTGPRLRQLGDQTSSDSSSNSGAGPDRDTLREAARAREELRREEEESQKAHNDRLFNVFKNAGDRMVELREQQEELEQAEVNRMLSARDESLDSLIEHLETQIDITRQFWEGLAETANQALDAAMRPVGAYIEITEQMTEAERKAAEESNALNKKRFEQNKLFGRGQIAISAAVGIARALEQPWPLNLLAATQTAIAAFAQLDALNSTSFGSPSTASVGGADTAANTGPVVPDAGAGTAAAAETNSRRRIDINIDFDGIDDEALLTGRMAKLLFERAAEEGLAA